MRVDAEEQRTVDRLRAPVIADGLRRGQDVQLVERRLQRRTAMPGRAESHALIANGRVGPLRVIRGHEARHVDQQIVSGTAAGC